MKKALLFLFFIGWTSVYAQFSEFSYRKKITIDNTQVGNSSSGSLTDFPVLILIDADNDLSDNIQNANGYDINFTDSADANLDFEVVSYSSGTLEAWVRIPSLSLGTNTEIYLYYGKTGVSADPSAQSTWNSDFSLVMHMESGTGESSGYPASITSSSTNTTGQVGGAQNYDGNGQITTVSYNALLDATADVTLYAWISWDATAGNNQPDVITKGTYQQEYSLWIDNGNIVFESEDVNLNSSGTEIPRGSSGHIALVQNSTTGRTIYFNGDSVQTDALTSGFSTGNRDLTISTTDFDFGGWVDEFRLLPTSLSADWIKTVYNNENNPSTFYSLSAEEDVCSATGVTLYSYQNGSWGDVNTWTTDLSGTTLVGSKIPTACDNVVIFNNRDVIGTATMVAKDVEIQSGSVFDLGTTTGHTFQTVSGTGEIKSSLISLPSADYSDFGGASGGTVRFSDAASGTFTAVDYNNVIIENTGSAAVYTVGSDLTFGGTFDVSGDSEIQMGNNTTARTVVFESDVTFDASSSLTVSNNNAVHNIEFQGNLTHNGVIDLANDAQYADVDDVISGAVEVTFTGSANASLSGTASQADFYRLILDKGTDQTYVLSTSITNFALYGPIDDANGSTSSPFSPENPEIKKALWIKNGTFRVQSGVSIPQLTRGGNDFFIPLNGCLWIDGGDVASNGDPTINTSNTGLTVIGKYRITDGTYNSGRSAGIVYRGTSELSIEGGVTTVSQYRPSGTIIGASNNSSYSQSGGVFKLRGDDDGVVSEYEGSAIFRLDISTSSFTMTGGEILIRDVDGSAPNAMEVSVDAANYSMTGGTITMELSGETGSIQVPGPIHNLKVSNAHGGSATTVFIQDQIITDSLIVESGMTFDGNGQNITIQGHVDVDGDITPGTGTWKATGSGNRNWDLAATSITNNVQSLIVNLDNASDQLTLTGGLSEITVSDSTALLQGLLSTTVDLNVEGSLEASGTISDTGNIEFVANTTHNWYGSGQVEKVSINGPSGSDVTVTTSGDNVINGSLTFVTGGTNDTKELNIGANELKFNTSDGAIVNGGELVNGNVHSIATNGLVSAKGVSMFTDVFGSVVEIPLATDVYAPAEYQLSQAPSDSGYLNVIPVNSEHPNVTTSGLAITYYWKTYSNDISLGSATLTWFFVYDNSDIVVSQADYQAAMFSGTTWNVGGTGAVIPPSTNNIDFGPGGIYGTTINGEWTAGDTQTNPGEPFGAVPIFYSRNGGGDWETATTWSDDASGSPVASSIPDANSIVIIQAGDTVQTTGNNQSAGNLTIQSGGVLDISDDTGHDFGVISGTGTFRQMQEGLPSGDFSSFLGSGGGTLLYYSNGSNENYDVFPSSCYNLTIELASGGGRIRTEGTITVLNDMVVDGSGGDRNFELNGANITVNGNLTLLSGDMQFRGNNGASTLTVLGDVTANSGARVQTNNRTAVHTFSIGGNLTANGVRFDMYNDGDAYGDLIFTGTGSATVSGSAVFDLWRVTMNKGNSTASVLTFNPNSATFQATEWLNLQNGKFIYSVATNQTLAADATNDYTIPSTAGFSLDEAGITVTVVPGNNADNDLNLQGELGVINGTIRIGEDGNSSGNDIIYPATGTPLIDLRGGDLIVEGQVRRTLLSTNGDLNLRITNGSEMTVKGESADASRGKLEVLNNGKFILEDAGSKLSINRGGGTTFGDLYLRPAQDTITAGTIEIAAASGISAAEEAFTVDIAPDVFDFVVDATNDNTNVTLSVNGLTVLNDLTLTGANASLDFNELNTDITRNLTLASGATVDFENTTTTFSGTGSTISGDFSGNNAFDNLIFASGNAVNLTSGNTLQVDGDFSLLGSGTVADNDALMDVRGDVLISGTWTSSTLGGTTGLEMGGSLVQELTGAGSLGNLIIDNPQDVNLESDFTLTGDLDFNNGKLYIQTNELALSNSITGYSSSSYIVSSGVLTDKGVKYTVSSGAQTLFLPIGVPAKYTPVSYNFASLTTGGDIDIRPVDIPHPSTTSDDNTQLDYYWNVNTTGVAGYSVTHQYYYDNGDVNGTESDYRAGRFFNGAWTSLKDTTGTVDDANDTITLFQKGYIDGEYTAGDVNEFGIAPTFYSLSGSAFHNWDEAGAWSQEGHAGTVSPTSPTGSAKIVIAAGDSIATNGNSRVCQSIDIDGTLYISQDFGHNFGRINGQGRLVLDVAASNTYISPAGINIGFASDTGGVFVYKGSINAEILSSWASYGGLEFRGTSTKTLPNFSFPVYGDFLLESGLVSNPDNVVLTVTGNWENNAGATAFSSGEGDVIFTGANQRVSGNNQFSEITVTHGSSVDSIIVTDDFAVTDDYTQNQGYFVTESADVDFTGTLALNATLVGDSLSDIAFTGSSTMPSTLTFGSGGEFLNDLTITQSGSTTLGSDLYVKGSLSVSNATFAVGANTLRINNAFGGTPANITADGTSTLRVTGSGSGISLPSGMTALKTLQVKNANGLTVSSALSLSDSLQLYNGTTATAGVTLGNGAWIDRKAGSVTGTLTFGTSVNLEYSGSTSITSGSEIPSDSTLVQAVNFSNAAQVTLASDLYVNGNLDLTGGKLLLDDQKLVIDNSYSQTSGTLSSSGSGSLVIRTTAAQNMPQFAAGENLLDELLIAQPNGDMVTLQQSIDIEGAAKLRGAGLILGAYSVNLSETATIEHGTTNQRYFVTNGSGYLRKRVSGSTGKFEFPIGENTGTAEYSPVSVNVMSGTFTPATAYVEARTIDANAPNCLGTTDFLSRYWDVQLGNITDYEQRVTMTYLQADVNGTEANIIGKNYTGSFCKNGDSSDVSADTISIVTNVDGEFTGGEKDLATEPTTASTSLVFSGVSKVTFTADWTVGDGTYRLAILKEEGEVEFIPVDGTFYNFDNNFRDSDSLDVATYAVYRGTGNNFTVTGLNTNKKYFLEIFEYNKEDTLTENYLTGATLKGQEVTNFSLDIDVLLEGPYAGDTEMTTTLNSNGDLPLSQPYYTLPWSLGTTETVGSIPNADIVDWVFVATYTGSTSADVIPSNQKSFGAYFLTKDGKIVDLDGTSVPEISASRSGDFVVLVQHRNHVSVLSAGSANFASGTYSYDFIVDGADASTPTVEVTFGVNAMLHGRTEYTNTTVDQLDYDAAWTNRSQFGYYPFDVNLDGVVNAEDRALIFNNAGATTTIGD
ncbi:MAG: hypothetical protein SchgKO_07660 [Schleiferiaceae bacterium]